MKKIISKYIDKLFVKQWTIGVSRGNIGEIIRNKTFNLNIEWLPIKSINRFSADPFLFRKNGSYNIFFEDFTFHDQYGKISVMTIDECFKQADYKILLDTKSHLSYPFVFTENNKIYVFPEASKSGKLSCYEYDHVSKSLIFLQDIIELPLLDSTILSHDNKYWLFGTLSGNDSYKLYVYFSNSLLGPYTPHINNPVKNALNGTRPAGNFIEVDGVIYRPSQNCENRYGESITINKIVLLNEFNVVEEPYMSICLNKRDNYNNGMHTIHTINAIDDIIVVDSKKWTFSPINQLRNFVKNRARLKRLKRAGYANKTNRSKLI